MRKTHFGLLIVLILGLRAAWPDGARAQGSFELVTGKAFEGAVPDRFYLEGSAIPTLPKRDGALVKTPAGVRVLFGLLNTSGYSSQIQEKYKGLVITEGNISIGGARVGVGSYGFGLRTPPPPSNEDARFFLYNQAGENVGEAPAKRDTEIKQPRPLQVVLGKGESARLYLGRYWLELK